MANRDALLKVESIDEARDEGATPKNGAPDWERIESDYRAGILSLREIAAADGNVTEGAIRKRAKRDSWERDLGAKIQAKADELVRKQQVRSEVRAAGVITERQIIEANAERIAQVRGEHRADITRMRNLVLSLLAECEAESGDPGLFAELGEILRSPDDNNQDKLNDAYHKAIALPTRIKGVKDLADTLKTLVALEREAYDLATQPANPLAGALPDMSLNDIGRLIAFTLTSGLKNKE